MHKFFPLFNLISFISTTVVHVCEASCMHSGRISKTTCWSTGSSCLGASRYTRKALLGRISLFISQCLESARLRGPESKKLIISAHDGSLLER
ncbi:hypothetical protein F5Y17DRAFT_111344 [Xylariaceae sp. FL0594]|nr:hypothetical protein F5Y17DRAFT_111344 [Xylariaceae sp. FL0594]